MDNIIRVHRPELTPEEYAKRMAKIKEAAEQLLYAVEEDRQRRKEKQ